MSNKTTGIAKGKAAKSIRFERGWLEEAARAAQATNHQPAVMFGFDPNVQDQREDWVAIPVGAFRVVNDILVALRAGDVQEAQDLVAVLKRTM